MKIAILNLYSGINNRGAESFIHDLAQNLSQNYDVTLYSVGKVSIPKVTARQINSQVFQPSNGFYGGVASRLRKFLFLDGASISAFFFTLKIFSMLKNEKYNVIIPLNGFWQLLICRIVSVITGAKIVVVGNSGPGWDERWNLYLKPHVFVATTEPTAEWARKICFWTKVVTIPYGIDIEKYHRAKPKSLNLEKPIILCPAAAVEYKRVDLTIKAVAQLGTGSLLYLGTGPLINELNKLGQELLGTGYINRSVPNSEMPGYYAAADVVTLPSQSQENSPMVFLEALAAEIPLVVTDTPRNRWLLGDAALYVNPKNINDYAKALETTSKKISKKELRLQAEKYAWPTVQKKYYSLLKSL